MSKFTKQQLGEYIKGCIEHAERFPGVEIADKEKAIFEIALAALTADIEQEPVAYQSNWVGDGVWRSCSKSRYQKLIGVSTYETRALYAAPQLPQPVPDELTSSLQSVAEKYECSRQEAQFIVVGWNACRNAMISGKQGDDHATD